MNVSQRLIDALKQLEGFTSPARHLPADRPDVITGGYGDTAVTLGQVFTPEQAEERLRQRVAIDFEHRVLSLVRVPLQQGQFDALVSLTYNIGWHALATSTLLLKLNARDYHGAAAEFAKWNKSCGLVQPGLVKRRAAEKAWFLEAMAPPVAAA